MIFRLLILVLLSLAFTSCSGLLSGPQPRPVRTIYELVALETASRLTGSRTSIQNAIQNGQSENGISSLLLYQILQNTNQSPSTALRTSARVLLEREEITKEEYDSVIFSITIGDDTYYRFLPSEDILTSSNPLIIDPVTPTSPWGIPTNWNPNVHSNLFLYNPNPLWTNSIPQYSFFPIDIGDQQSRPLMAVSRELDQRILPAIKEASEDFGRAMDSGNSERMAFTLRALEASLSSLSEFVYEMSMTSVTREQLESEIQQSRQQANELVVDAMDRADRRIGEVRSDAKWLLTGAGALLLLAFGGLSAWFHSVQSERKTVLDRLRKIEELLTFNPQERGSSLPRDIFEGQHGEA